MHQIATRGERARGVRLLQAAVGVKLREREPRAGLGVDQGAGVLGDAVDAVGAAASSISPRVRNEARRRQRRCWLRPPDPDATAAAR